MKLLARLKGWISTLIVAGCLASLGFLGMLFYDYNNTAQAYLEIIWRVSKAKQLTYLSKEIGCTGGVEIQDGIREEVNMMFRVNGDFGLLQPDEITALKTGYENPQMDLCAYDRLLERIGARMTVRERARIKQESLSLYYVALSMSLVILIFSMAYVILNRANYQRRLKAIVHLMRHAVANRAWVLNEFLPKERSHEVDSAIGEIARFSAEGSISGKPETIRLYETLKLEAEMQGLELQGSRSPVVCTAPKMLFNFVLSELLRNSREAKATKIHGEIRVQLDGGIHLSIEDDGEGFPPNYKQIAPSQTMRKGAHTGMGLWAASTALKQASGEIIFDNKSRLGGARVTIKLYREEGLWHKLRQKALWPFRSLANPII